MSHAVFAYPLLVLPCMSFGQARFIQVMYTLIYYTLHSHIPSTCYIITSLINIISDYLLLFFASVFDIQYVDSCSRLLLFHSFSHSDEKIIILHAKKTCHWCDFLFRISPSSFGNLLFIYCLLMTTINAADKLAQTKIVVFFSSLFCRLICL